MVNYVIRRLLLVPFILFGVTLLIFGMLQFLSPVERSALYVRDVPRNEKALESLIRAYGLDEPIYIQYWYWLVGNKNENTGEVSGGILRGEFGYSRTASQPVSDMIKHRFPATIELALWAVIPVVAGGIILGVVAATNHNKPIDHTARILASWAGRSPILCSV
jgi:peptide/nickel transport system permease protein